MGSKYERELKKLLSDEYDYVVIRSAGSMGEGDLVTIHPQTIILEVKKTSRKAFYTSSGKRSKEQFQLMQRHANKGIKTYYAVRFTRGDKETRWQMYPVTGDEEKGQYRRGEGKTLQEVFT